MIKRSERDPDEISPKLAKLIAPQHTAAFDRWRELSAQFDLVSNSEVGRSLKRMQELNSSLAQALKLNSPLTDALKQMEQMRLPAMRALKWMEGLRSPALEGLKLNSTWMDTFKQMEQLRLPAMRALKWMEGLRSPALEALKLNSPLMESLRQLEGLKLPSVRALKQFEQLTAPLAAIQAAKLWSDSLSGSHWAAQSSMQETFKLFQRAAEQAAAMARVDVSELATAVDASLGSLPLPDPAQRSTTPAASATARTGLEDFWNAQPFEVKLLLRLLCALLFMPLYNRLWVEAPPEAQPQIIESIHEDLGENFSRNLRCVRGSGVSIRESPSKTAHIIGHLGRSQAVAVIETEGSFSRIQYFDAATGEIREGWAASGYLVGASC